MKAVLCNLTARRNINSITSVLSLTHLEASPPHISHKILADRCDAFQRAGCSDGYLCCAHCALLSCVLPAVQGCYGCYSLVGLLQGSWHKDDLTSSVLVHGCVCLITERRGKGLSRNAVKKCLCLLLPTVALEVTIPPSFTSLSTKLMPLSLKKYYAT